MRILLDENVPLRLQRELLARGHDCQHVLQLAPGASDREVRVIIASQPTLFLTQDLEFSSLRAAPGSTVLVSRVPQTLPTWERVARWTRAIEAWLRSRPPGRILGIDEGGELVPVHPLEP